MDNGNRQLVLIKISKFPDGKLKSKLQWPYSTINYKFFFCVYIKTLLLQNVSIF